jgi:membrane fusion protein, multidrug efflux system
MQMTQIKHPQWFMVASLVALAIATGCERKGASDPPVLTTAGPSSTQPAGTAATSAFSEPSVAVRRGSLKRYATAVGTLRASQTTQIGSQVSGQVKAMEVDAGTVVKAGDVLVRLDPVFFEIEVQQLEASVKAAQAAMESKDADLQDRQREMKRQLDVFQRGAGSTKERDDAVTGYERAKADYSEQKSRLEQAEQGLKYAQRRLQETMIRAPYDGVVTKRLVDAGESVAVTPPTYLLETQDIGTLYLEFSLPQELLSVIHVGKDVEFEIEGVADFKGQGKISLVFPAVDEATRSFRCRVVIQNKGMRLRPGLLVEVRTVEQEAADALIIPRDAVRKGTKGWEVAMVEQGRPASRVVEVGLIAEDLIQVTRGLSEGERVLAPERTGR